MSVMALQTLIAKQENYLVSKLTAIIFLPRRRVWTFPVCDMTGALIGDDGTEPPNAQDSLYT